MYEGLPTSGSYLDLAPALGMVNGGGGLGRGGSKKSTTKPAKPRKSHPFNSTSFTPELQWGFRGKWRILQGTPGETGVAAQTDCKLLTVHGAEEYMRFTYEQCPPLQHWLFTPELQ
jgi:hypothetical protein